MLNDAEETEKTSEVHFLPHPVEICARRHTLYSCLQPLPRGNFISLTFSSSLNCD